MKILSNNLLQVTKNNINNFVIDFNDEFRLNPFEFILDRKYSHILLEIKEIEKEFFSYLHTLYKNPYDIEILITCLYIYERFVTINKNTFGYFSNYDLSRYDSNDYSKRIFEKLEANGLIRNLNNTRHRTKKTKNEGFQFTEKGLFYTQSVIYSFNEFSNEIMKVFLENLKYYTDETATEDSTLETIFLKNLTILIYSIRQAANKFNYDKYLKHAVIMEVIPLNLCKYIVQNKSIDIEEKFNVLLSIYKKDEKYKMIFEEHYSKALEEIEKGNQIDIEKLKSELPPENRRVIEKYVRNTKEPTPEGLKPRMFNLRKRDINCVERTKIQDLECLARELRNESIDKCLYDLKNNEKLKPLYSELSILSQADLNYFHYLVNKKRTDVAEAKEKTKERRKELIKQGKSNEEIIELFKKEKLEMKELKRKNSTKKSIHPKFPIEELNKARKAKQEQKKIENNKKLKNN